MMAIRRAVGFMTFISVLLSIGICFSQIAAHFRQETPGQSIARLLEWQRIHEYNQDKSTADFTKAEEDLRLKEIDFGQRLTKLEAQHLELHTEVDSISNHLWAVLIGVSSLLMNMLWQFIRPKNRHADDQAPAPTMRHHAGGKST